MNKNKVYKYKGKVYSDSAYSSDPSRWTKYDGTIYDLIEELSDDDDVSFEKEEVVLYKFDDECFTENELDEEDIIERLIENGEDIEVVE